MMKKSQNTIKKILQGFLILATLITMIVLGVFLWSLVSDTPKEEEPPIVNKEESYEMSVVDYEYFKFDDLDFNVLIAKINVKSNFPYSIPLSKLKTSENVFLNDIDSYLKLLQNANYKPSDKGLVFSLDANENQLDKDFTLFIPVRSKNLGTLELESFVKPYSKITFNLLDEIKWGDVQNLVIENNTISVSENISAKYNFMDYYIQSNFYTKSNDNKDTTVNFPTNTKVLGVNLTLVNKSDELQYKISKAKIIYNTNEEVATLDSSILFPYETNLLTQTIIDTTEGVLFFLVPSNETDFLKLNKQDMILVLEFSNGESLELVEFIGN